MSVIADPQSNDAVRRLNDILAIQRSQQMRQGPPTAETRIDRINRAIALLVDHQAELVSALNADFGSRSPDASLLTDIVSSVVTLKQARSNVRKWMKAEPRRPEFPFGLLGARAEVQFQPKGVVGVIVPWNFPVNLTFTPLAGILAAGNRAMIKPSEFTPAVGELMKRLFTLMFDESEIAVVTGGADVGAAFAALPFDHLLFTGSTAVGRHIMRAAADNLTPVTLELGGKSPVVLGRSADLERAAARIMTGKTLNAGQICLAPDYVLAPADRVDAFANAAERAVKSMYPKLRENPDYTAIINQRHFDRLRGLVADAREKGAKIVEINPTGEDLSQQEHRKLAPTLILGATHEMKVMQEEIFGPLLPVLTYSGARDAIDFVNARPRPLALYYFGDDPAEQDEVLTRTISGGVCINDVVVHVAQEDLPFGGVGASGIGAYHGRDGFLEFSHRRAVYRQTASELVSKILRPPYGDTFRKQVGARLSK